MADVRSIEPFTRLSRSAFRERFLSRFYDPAFDDVRDELERICAKAWDGYEQYRKSPRTVRAGEGFADPDASLPVEWLETRRQIQEAQAAHQDAESTSRILLINGSTRTEHSCPGEVSKTRRLVDAAREVIESSEGYDVDFLDISRLAFEPHTVIHPCKACVSTAMPLCNWPCSCYPNHALGQTNDWMAELYPRWVRAHGVMIVCPVHWYQAPAGLKLMIDRLVCADGGNPDPTRTGGKDPSRAKDLELAGWDYPKHLAGRAFAVVAHADASGPETLRRILADWLTDIGMVQAGPTGVHDTFIGYYKPYATSHAELDAQPEVFKEVTNAARSLIEMVRLIRTGAYQAPDRGIDAPREK